MFRPAALLLPLFLVLGLTITGCKSLGPGALREGRTSYNEAVRQTADQELLLNIVRLRYRETPSLLTVNNIAVQMSWETKQRGVINFLPSTADGYNLQSELNIYERPTIAYRPVVGQAFVEQMLRPVNETNIVLLYNAGWPVDTLFGLTVQSINGVDNAPGAPSELTDAFEVVDGRVTRFNKFQRLILDLRTLQRASRLSLGAGGAGGFTQARIDQGGDTAAAAQRVVKTLRLEAKAPLFDLGQATEPGRKNRTSIAVVTRSLMSTLFFLSQGVHVPENDVEAGRVPVPRDDAGQALEQGAETQGLFTVHHADRRPRDAYAAVSHRGRWFYIDDADLPSKTTFSLLSQLFAMQAGQLKNAGPLLTLPVGGG
ncbi:MAG: hypothetical protein AAGH92_04270 [Planctomycetota bacterium]